VSAPRIDGVPAAPPAPGAAPGPAPARPTLSVVAPAFNQAGTIYDSLGEIVARLRTLGIDHELIVVSDGSADATLAELARHRENGVRVLGYDRNLGKGYALRTGSAAARGEYVAWIDSDLDLDPLLVGDFLRRAVEGGLDVVAGSKRHPDSQVSYPTRRRVYSWLYQQLVGVLFDLDVRDTQVGMKLFRREVLEEVMPVVLVKRYAFDLEVLAVARRFGFERIAEAPIRLDYQFGASGVNWRAIVAALWDTAAVFYRLRLLRYYDRRRVLAHRIAQHRDAPRPSLSLLLAPAAADLGLAAAVGRLAGAAPAGTPVIVAWPEDADPEAARTALPGVELVAVPPGTRSERIAAALSQVRTDVVALVDEAARPMDGWAEAALALLADPGVGAVVGPTVARLGGDLRGAAAGVLSESRLGVGGTRIRHHVGRLREVGDFPARNLFARTAALRRAVEEGHPIDDDLCAALHRRHGLSVMCSPDVVVTTAPAPLFRPHLVSMHRVGVDRGRRIAGGRRPRARHLAPAGLVALVASGPLAARAGRGPARAWRVAMAAYGAALAGFGAVMVVLHRRPKLAGLAVVGAAASHAAFGVGLIRGVALGALRRLRRPA
jgi:glycosyltransferase involved in cell wall biosynthesis